MRTIANVSRVVAVAIVLGLAAVAIVLALAAVADIATRAAATPGTVEVQTEAGSADDPIPCQAINRQDYPGGRYFDVTLRCEVR